MFWQQESECMARNELEQLQLERLESTLNRVYLNVPFYRKKFDEAGFNPDNLGSLDDLRKLPFTAKSDLRENYPYGLFAVPLREVVRVHASSGTTGMSTVVGYTRNDIKTWSNLVGRVLTAGGVTADDVIQISFNYGLFTGAFGLHYGAERVGASVIPMSSGNTKRQIKIMQDFKTTALVSTPSYAMLIADTIREMNIDPNSLSLDGASSAPNLVRRHAQGAEQKLMIGHGQLWPLEVMGPASPASACTRTAFTSTRTISSSRSFIPIRSSP
jgi:phenylacetate-CoA ligase